jgi:hypothetical protein
VSEQRLNHANVRAALKQMGREAVAKRMQRERFTQPAAVAAIALAVLAILMPETASSCPARPFFDPSGERSD